MVSAVVMAGYQNKREVKRYSKIVAEHYGETFIEAGYKPLREFGVEENGVIINKPVIQFTLEQLEGIDDIEDIVIVGHQMLLERRLNDFFKTMSKPLKIVNQNRKFSNRIINQYHIKKRHVKFNSFAGNMVKGYEATRASKGLGHALFTASDSPLTQIGFIRKFLDMAVDLSETHGIIIPAVFIDDKEDKLGRKPLRLINDSDFPLNGYSDLYGRQGFRLSSLLSANLHAFDVNTVNIAYNLRKFLNPKVQIRLFSITRKLGFANVYSKYFLKRDLSVMDCEKITSGFFRGPLKLVPMEGETATYDYDGTETEYEMINRMLK
jgi:hypothetical protein